MILILSQYLRTLRERDEFDRLLPELLSAMGYVALTRPQTGIRQFGVDFAAVGRNEKDGIDEMLLFVIKQGDIGRKEWSANDPADLVPTLNEVVDAYLTSHVSPEHSTYRKVVVVATTGSMKQELALNWAGFVKNYEAKAFLEFWGGERISNLIEKYLLNENIFANEDRGNLRKALALAGDRDYSFNDLNKLIRRQLGLTSNGAIDPERNHTEASLIKAIYRVNLAAQICSQWAAAEGNSLQAVWISERALLWTWHRLQLSKDFDPKKVYPPLGDLWAAYLRSGHVYLEAMHNHFFVRDGMSGYCRENVEFSVMLFEHIGVLSAIGLSFMTFPLNSEDAAAAMRENGRLVAENLWALIENNAASGSPRLDRNVTEITLGLSLLFATGHVKEADNWLSDMALRLDFSFRTKKRFPISTDSIDDLAESEVSIDEDFLSRVMSTSWMLPTLAAWCALRDLTQGYDSLVTGSSSAYSEVCGQLWHPTEEWFKGWYFQNMTQENGETEAPYTLPKDAKALVTRILEFGELEKYKWANQSPALKYGIWPIDFIACRHFQMPLPASFWYRVARPDVVNTDGGAAIEP